MKTIRQDLSEGRLGYLHHSPRRRCRLALIGCPWRAGGYGLHDCQSRQGSAGCLLQQRDGIGGLAILVPQLRACTGRSGVSSPVISAEVAPLKVARKSL